ncbi:MAG: agmatine deiminase family protein [Bacteroidales bacterium]|nr:agmatine deiminase family protein [Bacteroidales bacterium]
MERQLKIKLINECVTEFFIQNPFLDECKPKHLMACLISKGVFKSDHREGLPLRDLLRELDSEGVVFNLIPSLRAERKTKNTYWFFMKPNSVIEKQKVFFSKQTKDDFPEFYEQITAILKENDIEFDFLKSTKDYYCRDYMPVQVAKNKFVQFVFNPISYFDKKDFPYIANPIRIQLDNDLKQPIYSRLLLDGGNVVKGKGKAIITDKVLTDNRYQMKDSEILEELERLLGVEIIIIPALKEDKTGHADGMIRFIDEHTVLINELGFEGDEQWETDFLTVLKEHQLEYKELPVFDSEDLDATGIYINYLHIGNLIIVPTFDHPNNKNDFALDRMKEYFPNHKIESVNATELAKNGGVLNCASWDVIL